MAENSFPKAAQAIRAVWERGDRDAATDAVPGRVDRRAQGGGAAGGVPRACGGLSPLRGLRSPLSARSAVCQTANSVLWLPSGRARPDGSIGILLPLFPPFSPAPVLRHVSSPSTSSAAPPQSIVRRPPQGTDAPRAARGNTPGVAGSSAGGAGGHRRAAPEDTGTKSAFKLPLRHSN
jgi:hypothetical protein